MTMGTRAEFGVVAVMLGAAGPQEERPAPQAEPCMAATDKSERGIAVVVVAVAEEAPAPARHRARPARRVARRSIWCV